VKRNGSPIEAFTPWAGLAIGVLAAGFVHQFGAEGTFDKCAAMAPGPLLVVAALGLIASALAGLVSWRSLRSEEGVARRVVAIISVGCAALFCLAILLPMIAALVLPPCFQ
jgi:CHASE2 domain-containing sensor protein